MSLCILRFRLSVRTEVGTAGLKTYSKVRAFC